MQAGGAVQEQSEDAVHEERCCDAELGKRWANPQPHLRVPQLRPAGQAAQLDAAAQAQARGHAEVAAGGAGEAGNTRGREG